MVRCGICKKAVPETFLKKLIGTTIKDEKGKMHAVCSSCQENLGNDKKKMLAEMK
jgi:hypothetical protein